jgi:hypothetical protein
MTGVAHGRRGGTKRAHPNAPSHRGGKLGGRVPHVHYVAADVGPFEVRTACALHVDVVDAVTLAEEVTCASCLARLADGGAQ